MGIEQIKIILSKGESQEVELKETFHSNQDISKIICGLSNTLGGVLLLGVSNEGKVLGIKENLLLRTR